MVTYRPSAKDRSGFYLEAQVKHCCTQVKGTANWGKEITLSWLKDHAIRRQRLEKIPTDVLSSRGELLDSYYGVDLPIAWKGWVMAIDVTCNKLRVPKKLRNLGWMCQPAHCPHPEGVDKVAVWYCTEPPTKEWVKATLDKMIHQSTYGAVYCYP